MAAVAAQVREALPTVIKAELVAQNGRLKGTRRRLENPTTFLGKSAGCDLRLNVDGISPLHCLLIQTGSELLLRDLESASGTMVNGERAAACSLRHGDQITVGPYHFQIQIQREAAPAHNNKGQTATNNGRAACEETAAQEKAALRVQAAAVAAQQAALGEWELRLVQREATLEKQQAQLASHLEEKRQRLVELHTQTQAARQAMLHEKQEHQRHVEAVTTNLGKAERDLLTLQQQNAAEKKRLVQLRQRLVVRARRHRQAERSRQEKQAADLDDAAQHLEEKHEELQQKRNELAQNCLRYNSEIELGRRQLKAEWEQLHQEQQRVRQHLQSRLTDILEREQCLVAAEKLLENEQRRHCRQVKDWQCESRGMDNRLRIRRRQLSDLGRKIQSARKTLEAVSHQRRKSVMSLLDGILTRPVGQSETPSAAPRILPLALPMPQEWRIETWLVPPTPVSTAAPVVGNGEQECRRHLAQVATLACELSDQRRVLAEHWQRLVEVQCRWNEERQALCAQMVAILGTLQQRAEVLMAREQGVAQAVAELHARYQEMLRFRERLIGWQGRLRSQEISLAANLELQRIALKEQEAALEQRQAALADLSTRWAELRQRETDTWHAKQESCDKAAEEYQALNQERRQMLRKLEEDRRALTTKRLALEQFRQECLVQTGNTAAAERRMAELQRRWSADELEALRLSKRECDGLQAELTQVRSRARELEQQRASLSNENQTLLRKQNEWQQHKLHLDSAQTQLRAEFASVTAQREHLDHQLRDMHREVERIARQLLDGESPPAILQDSTADSEAPVILSLDKAA